jgi:hypothetical protein
MRTSVKAPLAVLSALTLIAGCESFPQEASYLHVDDNAVQFVRWTQEGMRINGTIDVSERRPDGGIENTLVMFDGESDGETVGMKLKSWWTVRGGDKALKERITGSLKGDTLLLFLPDGLEPMQFRRATATERDEATKKLQTRAKTTKPAK